MKKLLQYMVLFLGLIIHAGENGASAQSWSYVGTRQFSAGAVNYLDAATYNGQVYVVFQDGANGQKATVMKFDGSSWSTVGNAGFSADKVYYTRIAINSTGEIYVAYKDYNIFNRPTVMKYDGSSWSVVGNAGFGGNTADYIDLALYNDTAFVAFQKNNAGVVVMKFNGTAWQYVGNTTNISYGSARYINLAVNSSGNLFVAHENVLTLQQKATLRKYEMGSWGDVGMPNFSAGNVSFVSLALDNGTPYVAYGEDTNAPNDDVTVMKYDGSNWVNVGTPGLSGQSVTDIDMEMYNGQPYVTFVNPSYKASVMTFDGSSWSYVGTQGFSAANIDDTQLTIDQNHGKLYVAFRDSSTQLSVMSFELNPNGIDFQVLEDDMMVYPNPSNGSFTIRSVKPVQIVEVYNLLGELVGAFTGIDLRAQNIDVSHLKQGIYMVNLKGKAFNKSIKLILR